MRVRRKKEGIEDIDNASTMVASSNQMAHARAEGRQGMFDAFFLIDGQHHGRGRQSAHKLKRKAGGSGALASPKRGTPSKSWQNELAISLHVEGGVREHQRRQWCLDGRQSALAGKRGLVAAFGKWRVGGGGSICKQRREEKQCVIVLLLIVGYKG